MNHSEAVDQMAAERYLLDEMSADEREAFESHVFECVECGQDLQAAALFMDTATEELAVMKAAAPKTVAAERKDWFGWLRPLFATPAIAAPAFGLLLVLIGYQNLVQLPALRHQAGEPSLMVTAELHGATRGSRQVIAASATQGVALAIPVEQAVGGLGFPSYRVELYDAGGKLVWGGVMAAPAANAEGDRQVVLALPAGMLHAGTYAVTVAGQQDQGAGSSVSRMEFDVQAAGQSK